MGCCDPKTWWCQPFPTCQIIDHRWSSLTSWFVYFSALFIFSAICLLSSLLFYMFSFLSAICLPLVNCLFTFWKHCLQLTAVCLLFWSPMFLHVSWLFTFKKLFVYNHQLFVYALLAISLHLTAVCLLPQTHFLVLSALCLHLTADCLLLRTHLFITFSYLFTFDSYLITFWNPFVYNCQLFDNFLKPICL